MATQEGKRYSDDDPYYKKDGTVPGLEAIALDHPDKYSLPENLTSEQTIAIATYAVLFTAQRITTFRSPTEVEAGFLKQNADDEMRKAFNGNIDHAIAGVKAAMEISLKFINSVNEHARQIKELLSK